MSFTCCCCYSSCRIKFEILLSPFFIVCYRLEIETTKRDVTMSIQTCVFIVTIYVSVSYVSSEQGSKSLDLKYSNHLVHFACLFNLPAIISTMLTTLFCYNTRYYSVDCKLKSCGKLDRTDAICAGRNFS